ncbi:MAG: FAD:protein FMN transferase [Bacteroidales bacterium]|nr:FAD:protein FMN transferase [Bacteroidales bacterium]
MKKKSFIALLVFLGVFILLYFIKKPKEEKTTNYYYNEGLIFGSSYHIKYQYNQDLQLTIDSILKKYDEAVSPYKPNSIVSKVNRNDSTVVLDEWFETLFNEGQVVAKATDGAFDITVAPLVEAWGFSFKKREDLTKYQIDSLKSLIGYKRVNIVNHKVVKDDPRITIDCVSMGDGYASDIIAKLFDSKGITNYMVEIGGELMMKGVNPDGKIWSVGIDKPVDNPEPTQEDFQQIVHFTNGALSTSGNYRKFYYKDGKKYAHTIDPKTGYPVQHSLLSATITAPTCIGADAYSTACMVIGLEKSMALVNRDPELEGYFIYTDKNGKLAVAYSDGFKKFMKE